MNRAGLPGGARHWLRRLPGIRSILAQAKEPVDEFHARKLKWAATEIAAQEMEPSITNIRKLSKLTGPIGPLAKKVIRDLND
jgi:hypothetical protein